MNSSKTDLFKAQHQEDELLAQHFQRPSGYYVEVGAYNGVDMSNTYYFEQIGWKGILIEADPELAASCRATRLSSIIENCAVVSAGSPASVTFEIAEDNKGLSSLHLTKDGLHKLKTWTGQTRITQITVPARTLDAILSEHVNVPIDFMTIDVEGHEWEVLQGFTISQWKPKIVIIERNRLLPDARIMNYMHAHDYAFGRTTGVNDWFFRAPGKSSAFSYRLWLACTFYGPKYVEGARNRVRHLLKV